MINKILTLHTEEKIMILDQGYYKNKNYYFTCKLDEQENLTEQFQIFEESITNGTNGISSVKDNDTLKVLIEYFKDRVENNK